MCEVGMSIPVIDLQQFPNPVEYTKLREACENWGCFRMVNHPIPLTLMAETKKVATSLLDLPMEIKKRNNDVIFGSGYMAPSEVNPLYESLGLYDMSSSQAVQDACSLLDAAPHQREIIEAYGKAIHGVAVDIGEKMAESLGLVGYQQMKDWPCQYRFNKYNFSPETVGSPGIEEHTDSGFLTVLQDDETVDGLEVMQKYSGSFVSVPPCPGSLFVNLGDVGTAWSNGRFYNVKHRVVCQEASRRVSMAAFLLGPRKEKVEAPAELVDSDHPRLYRAFTIEEYRKLRGAGGLEQLKTGEALHHYALTASNNLLGTNS